MFVCLICFLLSLQTSIECFNFRGQLLEVVKQHQKDVIDLRKELESKENNLKAKDSSIVSSKKNVRALKSEESSLQKKLTDVKAEAKAEVDKPTEKHQAL